MVQWLARHQSSVAALLIVVVAFVALGLVTQLSRRPVLQVSSPAPSGPAPIKVHVVGAVLSPGVYQLAADARVEDGLAAAGGPAPAADVAALNLALPLRDGQQLVVPAVGQRPTPHATTTLSAAQASPAATAPSGTSTLDATARPNSQAKLDLNSANLQQLDTLPGIGPVTGQRILDYRNKNGRIVAVEELLEAKLVNRSTYDRIKDLVEVR